MPFEHLGPILHSFQSAVNLHATNDPPLTTHPSMATTLSIDGPSAILPTTPYTPAPETIDVPGLKTGKAAPPSPLEPAVTDKLDIEHVYVQDDPRKWSPARKVCVLDLRAPNVPSICCRLWSFL